MEADLSVRFSGPFIMFISSFPTLEIFIDCPSSKHVSYKTFISGSDR